MALLHKFALFSQKSLNLVKNFQILFKVCLITQLRKFVDFKQELQNLITRSQ